MGFVRRDVPGRLDHHEVGDRAGQGAAEHPVARCEAGHSVTDLVDDPRVVGPEPGRQAQAEPACGAGICRHEPIHRVQPSRGDPNTDLPRSGLRSGNLNDAQDFGAAEGIEPDGPAPARRYVIAPFLHAHVSPWDPTPFATPRRSN